MLKRESCSSVTEKEGDSSIGNDLQSHMYPMSGNNCLQHVKTASSKASFNGS